MKKDTVRTLLDATVWLVSSAFLVVLVASQADAAPPATATGGAAATWREECGGCHIPFPARLLPGNAWNVVLDGLDRHYGVDASLAPASVREIRSYLAARAEPGTAHPVGAPRITTSPWFRREHDDVPPAVWKRARVGSAANCGACHAGAAEGNFDEDSVRIPR
jgi:mono/diheme cytochrome c family protein